MLRLRTDGVTWRELDGEVVALDLESATYLTTNKTGTVLWHVLVKGGDEQDLVSTLQQRYGLQREPACHDVAQFLKALRGHRLLVED